MPWHLVKRGGRTCIVKDGTSDPIPGGCHADEAEAKRHLAALYANEPGATKHTSLGRGPRRAYSEDQPRDYHGRFGEGDGSSKADDRPTFSGSSVGATAVLKDGKASYNEKHGLDAPSDRDWSEVMADPDLGSQIADDYDAMSDYNPAAEPAYDALATEVGQQYEHLTEDLGVQVEFMDHDPYENVAQLKADIEENNHLGVLSTEATPPGHPYLSDRVNDEFRAVHDAFGHAAIGRGFDRNGEEAAYQSHAEMFTAEAVPALASETRGQNSALNYGGYGARDEFPPQKFDLLPAADLGINTERTTLAAAARAAPHPDEDNLYDVTGVHHTSLGRSFAKTDARVAAIVAIAAVHEIARLAYSEDQPRVPAGEEGGGQFGEGGGGGSTKTKTEERPKPESKAPSKRSVTAVVKRWSGSPGGTNSIQNQADSLLSTGQPLDREAEGYSEQSKGEWADRAETMMSAVEHSEPDAPELWRGIALNADPGYEVGGTTTFSLGSFSENKDHSEGFARGMLYKADTPVLFHLEEGSRSLSVNPLIGQDSSRNFEKEWITGGTFEITSVETRDFAATPGFDPERPGIEVGLKQTEVVSAPVRTAAASSRPEMDPNLSGSLLALRLRDERLAKGTRQAYSEDQPRDYHGRFGEGDGGGSTADRPISMQEKLRQIESRRETGSTLMAPSKAHSDAELRIEAVVGENGGVNLDGVNEENLDAIAGTVERCAEDFPGSTDGLYIGTGDLDNLAQGDHEFSTPFAAVSPGGGVLTLDRDWFGGDPELLRAAAYEGAHHRQAGDDLPQGMVGFHPESTGTPEGIVWHELGHVVDKAGMLSHDDPLWGNSELMNIAVSGYAAENRKEAFAEAFAAYNTGGRLPGDVVDSLAKAGATVKAAAAAAPEPQPETCVGYVQPWMVKAARSTTKPRKASIVSGMGCTTITRDGVSYEVHDIGCRHSMNKSAPKVPVRMARLSTTPLDEIFDVPEYAPSEWYAEEDPDEWIATWRAANGIDPDGDIKRLTITEEGRVGGRFYDAGSCIIGAEPGSCPQPSLTKYAAFHQQDAVTEDGSLIVVGAIGNSGGHSSRIAPISEAMRANNDPRIQVMRVRAYDDAKGGYIVGSLVPAGMRRAAGVDPLTFGSVQFLRSCALSGTWYPTAAYGFTKEWWEQHGITPAQVASVQGYDCIGPSLVTRPALPLVRAVKYASIDKPGDTPTVHDQPILIGGLGGVPDIDGPSAYSAEEPCETCEEDDVDDATKERIERLEAMVASQQEALDRDAQVRAAAIEEQLDEIEAPRLPPPPGFDERTIHLTAADFDEIARQAAMPPQFAKKQKGGGPGPKSTAPSPKSAPDRPAAQRREDAKSGLAMPDGSYRIATLGDLENAKQAIGRAPESKRAAVIAHINKRAKALGGKPVGETSDSKSKAA